MKSISWIAAASLSALAMPVAAGAQTAPATAQPAAQTVTVKAGDTVFDGAGDEVGKIESVANGVAVLNTGNNRASVPVTSLGQATNGLSLGMTKAELDQAASAAAASVQNDLRSKLVAGTPVHGSNGAEVATVKEVKGDNVTLASAKGDVTVPLSGIGMTTQGVTIGMTQQEFEAAVTQAQAQSR